MQISTNTSRRLSGSTDISLIRMPTLIAIDDPSILGYQLNAGKEVFLTSSVGIFMWTEKHGEPMEIEGNSQVSLIQTSRGPAIEVSSESAGVMAPLFQMRCIDLMGMSPASDVPERMVEYREMLSDAREFRTMH